MGRDITIHTSKEVGSRMDELAEYAGLGSRFELVREALVLYDYMCNAYRQGGHMSAFFNGNPVDVLEALKTARRKGESRRDTILITDYMKPLQKPDSPRSGA